MATTATERATSKDRGATGRVVRIIGPVVDVEFPPDGLPTIQNALTVERSLDEGTTVITCEVAQHIGDSMVRAIAMQPTELACRRGMPCGGATCIHTMPRRW